MPVSSTSLQAPREASLSRTSNSSPARTWGGIEAQRRRSVRRAPANTVRDLRLSSAGGFDNGRQLRDVAHL